MAFKLIVLCAALAVANAGYLGGVAAPVATYAAAPVHAAYAAPVAHTYAAPAGNRC